MVFRGSDYRSCWGDRNIWLATINLTYSQRWIKDYSAGFSQNVILDSARQRIESDFSSSTEVGLSSSVPGLSAVSLCPKVLLLFHSTPRRVMPRFKIFNAAFVSRQISLWHWGHYWAVLMASSKAWYCTLEPFSSLASLTIMTWFYYREMRISTNPAFFFVGGNSSHRKIKDYGGSILATLR